MAGPETVVLWPASIMLLGLETNHSATIGVAMWVACGIANVVLYAALAWCFAGIYRSISRRATPNQQLERTRGSSSLEKGDDR